MEDGQRCFASPSSDLALSSMEAGVSLRATSMPVSLLFQHLGRLRLPFPPAVPSSDLADSIESGISFRGGTQGSRTAWMLSCWSGTGAWGGGVAGALAWKNMGIWYCRSCEAVCFLRGLGVGGNFCSLGGPWQTIHHWNDLRHWI
jgi:hypothetical protein